MRNRRAIRYPKLALLAATFILGYIFLADRQLGPLRESLSALGYAGTFLAGMFFSYGFTAAPATAALLVLGKGQDIFLTAIIGGFGALLADTIIFRFIRHSFAGEIKRLSKERMVADISSAVPKRALKYIVPVLGGFIIASPLPDEIGVSLLAASTNVSGRAFTAISFALNTAGIFVLLALGNGI